jgi:hypothetical protein
MAEYLPVPEHRVFLPASMEPEYSHSILNILQTCNLKLTMTTTVCNLGVPALLLATVPAVFVLQHHHAPRLHDVLFVQFVVIGSPHPPCGSLWPCSSRPRCSAQAGGGSSGGHLPSLPPCMINAGPEFLEARGGTKI